MQIISYNKDNEYYLITRKIIIRIIYIFFYKTIFIDIIKSKYVLSILFRN